MNAYSSKKSVEKNKNIIKNVSIIIFKKQVVAICDASNQCVFFTICQ